MGPRSSDRGYVLILSVRKSRTKCFNGSTVLRPWLCTDSIIFVLVLDGLQWVHGPQTVVMPLSLQHGDRD